MSGAAPAARATGAIVLAVSLCGHANAGAAATSTAPADAIDEIQVVATGLFPGIGVDATLVPNHVQHIGASTIARQH